jgi:hypothetical protein
VEIAVDEAGLQAFEPQRLGNTPAAKAARGARRGRTAGEKGGDKDVNGINLASVEECAEDRPASFDEEVGDPAAAELLEQGYDRDEPVAGQREDLAATCAEGRLSLGVSALGHRDPDGDLAGAADEPALQG